MVAAMMPCPLIDGYPAASMNTMPVFACGEGLGEAPPSCRRGRVAGDGAPIGVGVLDAPSRCCIWTGHAVGDAIHNETQGCPPTCASIVLMT
jgi:hypothetical protein